MTIFLRTAMVLLIAAGYFAAPAVSFAKDKEKKPKVSELLKDANEYMTQAQSAYIDGKAKEAVEFYRKSLAEIARVERENEKDVGSSEFAPLRFRKALCETEIDRIMLEEVNATARTVAVTDTRALEVKREERKKAAETNNVPERAVKLASKQGSEKTGEAAPVEDVSEKGKDLPALSTNAVARAEDPSKPFNVKEELEWAKDMISVDRFEDANKALMKILKLQPEHREARFLLALSHVQQGHPADAVVIFEDLLADNANDVSVLLLAAGAYVANGHYSKAMDALDKAMKVDPKRPDGYLDMAWLLLEMNPKGSDEAEMYYRQSVKLGGARDRDIERRLGIKPE